MRPHQLNGKAKIKLKASVSEYMKNEQNFLIQQIFQDDHQKFYREIGKENKCKRNRHDFGII